MKDKLYWKFAGSCCLVLFMIIGYIVKFYESTFSGIDTFVTHLIRNNMTSGKTNFFLWITKFGSVFTIAFLMILLIAFLYKYKYKVEIVWLIINVALVGGVGNVVIKLLFLRQRPDLQHLVTETSSSFPSGHSMCSMLFYGTLIIILTKLIENKTILRVSQIILALLICLIGTSRIYLGVHYPTDVLGGFLLGASWLFFSYPYYDKYQFIYAFKGKQL